MPVAYMAKTYHLFKVDKNKIEGSFIGHIVHGCQQYCSTFFITLNYPSRLESLWCARKIFSAHLEF